MSGIECAFFGTLGKDAEHKTSSKGRDYLRLNVRVGSDEAAQWVAVTSFDSAAIAVVGKMVRGARVYCEGRLSLEEWTAQGGTKRTGLSCLSWHTRLSAIGRNKPAKAQDGEQHATTTSTIDADMNDQIPF